jgi:hypothetical protein
MCLGQVRLGKRFEIIIRGKRYFSTHLAIQALIEDSSIDFNCIVYGRVNPRTWISFRNLIERVPITVTTLRIIYNMISHHRFDWIIKVIDVLRRFRPKTVYVPPTLPCLEWYAKLYKLSVELSFQIHVSLEEYLLDINMYLQSVFLK